MEFVWFLSEKVKSLYSIICSYRKSKALEASIWGLLVKPLHWYKDKDVHILAPSAYLLSSVSKFEYVMCPTICNWWKSCYHQRQLMQIIGLTIGGALSQLASQQEAIQENWFNLLYKNNVLAKSCYRWRLFTSHILYCLCFIERAKFSFSFWAFLIRIH